ncbi:UNVERIFIED_ORG: hypothetical protein J2W16_001497 [Pseudomonas cremoricolorata]|nr:hypothetical protein [Pseudomonas cremoricolorata]
MVYMVLRAPITLVNDHMKTTLPAAQRQLIPPRFSQLPVCRIRQHALMVRITLSLHCAT